MSIKQQYINFANFITKNALVVVLLILVALTTVSASAAEVFAPDEYKPSRILGLVKEDKKEEVETKEFEGEEGEEDLKVEQKKEEIKVEEQEVEEKIYTNPNFPSLKIDYSAWSLNATENVFVENTGMAKLRVELRKQNSLLEINIVEPIATGFTPSEYFSAKNLGNGLARLKHLPNNAEYDYRPSSGLIFKDSSSNFNSECEEIIGSKLPSNANACGTAFILNIDDYWVIASYTGDSSLLPEVDRMILNSGIEF